MANPPDPSGITLRVADTFEIPDLTQTVTDLRAVESRTARERTTVYYDTEDLRLYRWGVSLRRTSGAKDSGWFLTIPIDDDTTHQSHLPLSAGRPGRVPAEFREAVTALTRGAELIAVATVHIRRQPSVLVDVTGHTAAEIGDDLIEIVADGGVARRIRELEIETRLPEAAELVRRVAADLVDDGAITVTRAQLAVALGTEPAEPDVPVPPNPGKGDPAGDALRAHLAKHVQRFLLADVRVRRETPEGVHDQRVAARHLRSSLKTFKSLVDAEWASWLRDELRWAANHLGVVRDCEVQLKQTSAMAESLSPEHAELANRALTTTLTSRMTKERTRALAEMSSPRYLTLVERLVDAANDPKLTDKADRPSRKILPRLVDRSWRTLAEEVGKLGPASSMSDWHEARKDAKRTRYAADLAAPILGKGMKTFAHEMSRVTDVLGDLHDADVAEQTLTDVAQQRRVDGPTGYALGLLACRERQEQARLREAFTAVWPGAARAHAQL